MNEWLNKAECLGIVRGRIKKVVDWVDKYIKSYLS